MSQKNNKRSLIYKWSIYFLLTLVFVSAMAISTGKKKPLIHVETQPEKISASSIDDKKSAADKKREQESVEAFLKAYTVFMHPRCLNCHPAGDIPLQGDDSHLHAQGVKRGPDGKGLFALKCKNCHQDEHVKGEHMPPGHKDWHLPPQNLKMVFEGKTPKQLAMHFKNPAFTGFKSLDKMIEHVEKEPLVLNSWTYGNPPPMSHAEFVASVKEWIAKGAVVPR